MAVNKAHFLSRSRLFLFYTSILVWIYFWIGLTIIPYSREAYQYESIAAISDDALRNSLMNFNENTQDYYYVLQLCDRWLARDEKLQCIFSKTNRKEYEFFTGKSRYYLYPRNYGNNKERQDCILVYNVESFEIPEGYKVAHTFGKNKYLIANSNCSINKTQ